MLRCRGITQHFLRLSRGQSGAADFVDIGRTVGDVIRLIGPTARAAGVRLVPPADASPILVRADEAELQHALMNVVLNAVQACKAGGTVTVDAAAGPPARVRVADTGCGIGPHDRTRIFEPFFGLRQGGTGLGLFLALNFMRRWGGDISVSSEPGRGAVFDLTLPSAAADQVPS